MIVTVIPFIFKNEYTFLVSAACPINLILDWITLIILGSSSLQVKPEVLMKVCMVIRSWDISVSIVTGVQFPPGRVVRFSSLHHNHIWTGSGSYPAPNPVGTRSSFPRGKWPGCEADHLHQVPRLRMYGAVTPLPINLHGVVLS